MSIKENLIKINKEINDLKINLKNQNDVKIIAVSKKQSIDKIISAYRFGQKDFGESRIQEAEKKIQELEKNYNDIVWHFVGSLQSNKAKKAVKYFDYIHSIDKIHTAEEVDKYCKKLNKKIKIFIQINTTEEKTKSGVKPSEVDNFINVIKRLKYLEIIGFMTIGPHYGGVEENREAFAKLRQIRDIQKEKNKELNLNYLSMGMSGDYTVAIEEGATHIRIGTKIFGEREY